MIVALEAVEIQGGTITDHPMMTIQMNISHQANIKPEFECWKALEKIPQTIIQGQFEWPQCKIVNQILDKNMSQNLLV